MQSKKPFNSKIPVSTPNVKQDYVGCLLLLFCFFFKEKNPLNYFWSNPNIRQGPTFDFKLIYLKAKASKAKVSTTKKRLMQGKKKKRRRKMHICNATFYLLD